VAPGPDVSFQCGTHSSRRECLCCKCLSSARCRVSRAVGADVAGNVSNIAAREH
jgi:hypothetical protein